MGLLQEAGAVILRHLQRRETDPDLHAEYRAMWARRGPEVLQARRQLAVLHPGNRSDRAQWPVAVREDTSRWARRTRQGALAWWESWQYPSRALLLRQTGVFLYGLRVFGVPTWPLARVEGTLHVLIVADGAEQPLALAIPLTDPWGEPRLNLQHLKRLASPHWGKLPRAMEREVLRDFETHLPDDGPRLWRVPILPMTPIAEVMSLLAVLAQKQGFPVAEAEERYLARWLRRVMRGAFRRWHITKEARTQLVEELVGTVHERLLAHFEQPGTPWALPAFIQATANGLAKNLVEAAHRRQQAQDAWADDREIPANDLGQGRQADLHQGLANIQGQPSSRRRREPGGPELRLDPVSGEPTGMVYPAPWVAQKLGVSRWTIGRWMQRHGWIEAPSGARALTEEQWTAIRQQQKDKDDRAALMRYQIETLGKSKAAAKKSIQRSLDAGKTLTEIATVLLSSRRGDQEVDEEDP